MPAYFLFPFFRNPLPGPPSIDRMPEVFDDEYPPFEELEEMDSPAKVEGLESDEEEEGTGEY